MIMINKNPVVLVYRDHLLDISETFVYNQSFRLSRYDAFAIGSKYAKGVRILLPEDRFCLINKGGITGKARETAFKLFGYIPSDVIAWAQSLDIKLIHAHFGPDGSLAIPLSEQFTAPLIVSFHGYDATLNDKALSRTHLGARLYLKRRARLAQKLAKVVVHSKYVKQCVLKHGYPESKIQVIAHGVDLAQFKPTEKSHEWGHILFVGRLVPVKGLQYLIEALSSVKQRFPDIFLTIIGDGPMRDEYNVQAKEKLGSGYDFLGSQPNTVVQGYMEKAYIFSVPSKTMSTGEAEAFGVVFVEAQAIGIPVVSFASGGIPEVINHEETGFLAKEGDVASLAKYIEILLMDANLWAKMGQAGRKRVEHLFDLAKQNAKLETLYDEVLISKFDAKN